jgi:hypothetical protein
MWREGGGNSPLCMVLNEKIDKMQLPEVLPFFPSKHKLLGWSKKIA